MPKFTEDQLNNFRYPPSDTEEQKLANSEFAVREAIKNSAALKDKSTKIFGQGSYANDTNVRNNSDIDINVRLDSADFVKIPDGKNDSDYGYSDSSYSYPAYRKDVLDAMISYFGLKYVVDNDKCITILPDSTRVETDVVPTLKYIRYDSETAKVEGVKFISKSGKSIINFPLQHIENGKGKNSRTQKRFKRLTRIYRRIRYKMIDDGIDVSDNVTSFLLECLVWNVPDKIFNDYDNWTDRLKESIRYIYNKTQNAEDCKHWGEVSELLYLFVGRKWSEKDVNNFMLQMWNYLQF
ncbi:nucleotidyltransferase domain-containing protein [Flavobacterium selenitireducens]|uniref:nucleotidyltransferase domain-containing protein n=1 Tax=Flavobacterium selenitireducens TaxID=2722704 RepID=UPI00168B54DC|nr:nucleotidyltransferase [Flavobacterium selenitireducens]MBD3584024.1 nucleotidyltransferase [Flavobacterium selenitireducens]